MFFYIGDGLGVVILQYSSAVGRRNNSTQIFTNLFGASSHVWSENMRINWRFRFYSNCSVHVQVTKQVKCQLKTYLHKYTLHYRLMIKTPYIAHTFDKCKNSKSLGRFFTPEYVRDNFFYPCINLPFARGLY